MTITADRARTIAITLAATGGVAMTLRVFSPGVMSPDSLGAYRQAITGVIDGSTKTPVLAFLWMWIVKVWPGPFGMLLMHALMFWIGLALIVAAARMRPLASALSILAIGFFPTVFALLGMIWSDVLLAVSLTLFFGLALTARNRRSKGLLLLALVPLWLGLSARVNALPAVIPLTAWVVALWFEMDRQPARIRSGRFVLAWLLMTLGLLASSKAFDRLIIDHGSGSYTRSLQFAFFHDLAGIAVQTGDLRLPSRVYRTLPTISLEAMKQVYDPSNVNLLIYNPQWNASDFLTTDGAEFRELVGVWSGAIAAHPAAYLQRRLEAIDAQFQVRSVYYPFHDGIDPNEFGLEFKRDALYERLTHFLLDHQGWFFRGWVFLLASSLIVVIGARRRCWSAVALAASGLLYVAPFILITTGADFRYIWWMVVATLLSAMILIRCMNVDGRPGTARSHRMIAAP